MDKRNKKRTAVIIYFGVSIQTTPKVLLIKSTLEKEYEDVIITGITARPYLSGNNYKIIPIESKSRIRKVLSSAKAIIEICHWIGKKKPSLIYAINPIPGLIAAFFKRTLSINYIYETLEIFGGIDYFPYNRKYRKLWYQIEKIAICTSEKSFTTDEFRLKFLRRYFKVKDEKLSFTYNTNKATTISSNHINKKKLILSYCGGVYPGRQIEEILQTFSLLKETHPTAKLVIAGGGPSEYLKRIRDLSSSLMISSSVEITGHLPNEQLKEIMRESTITFAFYKGNSLNNRLNSPNKIFDSIFSKTTLITSSSPLSRKIIASNHVGEVVKSTSPVEILEKCLKLISSTFQNPDFDSLIDKYCWESEEKKILKVLPKK